MRESIPEFFEQHFSTHRNERAFRQRRGYRTDSFTYGEVLKMAFGFARKLEARGISKGDRVMLWGENSAEWVAVFFGCAMRGVIAVPMDDTSSIDFVVRVVEKVEAKLLVGSRRHLLESAAAGVSVAMLAFGDLDRTVDASVNSLEKVAIVRDDILQIVFTSGTTAEPKGVVITHGNVLDNIAPLEREMRAYLKYERLVHPLRFLHLLPLSHVFGQFLGMFLPLLLGATVIFQDDLKPSEVMSTIRRDRVSVLVSVPRVLQSLKQKIERDLADRGNLAVFRRRFEAAKGEHFLRRWWRFRALRRQFGWKFWALISGGAALDRDSEEFWGRLGYAAIQGYGLTETTSVISVNHPFKLSKGSIGKVLPGREVKLAADGEILVRGSGVSSGYWDGRAARKISDAEGWYGTGDIGALDDAGNLYFKGRKKEVIVTPGGTNIYPGDLEAALRQQAEVKDCVVVGLERDGNAEPCAVVILRDDPGVSEANLADVVRRANELLAEYQRMRMWLRWPDLEFPRTSTGKPKRSIIKAEAEARLVSPLDPLNSQTASAGGPLAELIARISRRPAAAVDENANLDSDLGLSSLDRVELLSALEDRYQVDLSETRFSAVRTVGDLERMLRGEAAPGAGYHYPSWTLRWPVTWVRLAAHYLLMRPAMLLLGWPRIEGRENLRGVSGPLLVVSNHVGDVDGGFILTALPSRFRHRLATATGGEALEALRVPAPSGGFFLRAFFQRVYDRTKWLLGVSLLNLFPLPREAGFRRSFAYAGEAVDRGYSILVFPEGRHTADGRMSPFRSGIGLLAQNLGIPVLPMRIDGLYAVRSAGRRFAAPGKILVRIGKPISFESGADPDQIAAALQSAVENL
jgi:long-chain acyl-CoA synthetase